MLTWQGKKSSGVSLLSFQHHLKFCSEADAQLIWIARPLRLLCTSEAMQKDERKGETHVPRTPSSKTLNLKVIRFSCVGLCRTMRPSCEHALKALSHECRIGQRITNEKRLTHEKEMTLSKEKNNTHKQRTLTNDGRPFKESLSDDAVSAIRIRDECHPLICVSYKFDPLNGRSSLDNVRCFCSRVFSSLSTLLVWQGL